MVYRSNEEGKPMLRKDSIACSSFSSMGTQCLEKICTSAFRTDRPVSVLGKQEISCSSNQSGKEEILKVPNPSPPVPQVDQWHVDFYLPPFPLETAAQPAISSPVTPLH
jgi:hypothetical protein